MTAEQFAYWLNGFIEMNPNAMITNTQWETLKDHLKTVFNKETPNRFHQFPTNPLPGLQMPSFGPGLVTC